MADIAAPPVAPDAVQGVIAAPAPVSGAVAAVPTTGAPAAPAPSTEPEFVSETLYIQNLNEKIKIPGALVLCRLFGSSVLTICAIVLKASLRGLFKSYGEVLDVVAHGNLRMRGQAFVSFESAEIAKKALKEVRGFPLYSKPMVRTLDHPRRPLADDALANIIRADTFRRCREEAGRTTL